MDNKSISDNKEGMLIKLQSCAVVGLQTHIVEVEVDVSKGEPKMFVVGLGDMAVQEAKSRIRLAIRNSWLSFPNTKRIVINLAPADLKKEGAAFDIAMALGILLSHCDEIPLLENSLFIGELALDGSTRSTAGILPVLLCAKEHGISKVFVPEANIREATLIKGINIYPVQTLKQLYEHMMGKSKITPFKEKFSLLPLAHEGIIDMGHIAGQEHAKRALEIVASGGHNILMSGPPGSGKTLLAKAIPSILPSMTQEEILEVSKIYSVVGQLPKDAPIVTQRPFRSPHHSASGVSLVGGGKFPAPGEITLAHRGVLFLDEFPEFPRKVIEALRQPLEDGIISISRAAGSLVFPARFILVTSMNPCPCGFTTDPEKSCSCTAFQINKYQQKLSGPILDRIDLHIDVPRLDFEKISNTEPGENSITIRKRVEKAREIQQKRFKKLSIMTNTEMGVHDIKKYCILDAQGRELIKTAMKNMQLSGRAFHRILKVSRTISDLDDSTDIKSEHIAEALQYRAS